MSSGRAAGTFWRSLHDETCYPARFREALVLVIFSIVLILCSCVSTGGAIVMQPNVPSEINKVFSDSDQI